MKLTAKAPASHTAAFRRFPMIAVMILGGSLLTPSAHGQAQTSPAKTPPVGPAAPQSIHFPVLLLGVGMNPAWDVRIGANGPERIDRPGYPPILLEAGEVNQEAPNAWVYHAKDTQTGAAVSVLVTRDACSDGSPTKYSFRTVVQHTQLGTLNGCARIAAELFPKLGYQQDDDTKDDTDTKKKDTPETTVTSFKMPVDTAYISPTGKVILRHGAVPHIVGAEGSQLSLSHDGKRLLYTRVDKTTGEHTIVLYDAVTAKTTELLTGNAQQPFWSPDETRIAFTKFVDGHWKLWIAPASAPATAAPSPFTGDVAAIEGWTDAHTVLVDDLTQLSWVGDDGKVQRTIADRDVCGDSFIAGSSSNSVRVHPANPDLLLVSAEMNKPSTESAGSRKVGAGFFLYELSSKRRALMTPPEMTAAHAEWSRDGVQIFFTGMDAAAKRTATYHIFWDGPGLKRFVDGRELVVGQ